MLRTRHCGGIFHFWPKTPGPLISRNFTRDWAAVFPRSSPGIEAPLGAHTSPRRSGVVKGGGCASFGAGFGRCVGAGGLAAGFGRRKGAASGRKRAENGGFRGKTAASGGETFGRKRGFGWRTAHSGRQNQRLRAEKGGVFGRKVCFFGGLAGKKRRGFGVKGRGFGAERRENGGKNPSFGAGLGRKLGRTAGSEDGV